MSTITKVIPVIDTHTAGEPTRIILRCPWKIPGKTMEVRRKWFEENCSDFRSLVLGEPRGHHDMFGAVLLDPVSEDADFGVFFIENEGTLPMCVHGSMGVAAALFKMGFPGNKITLDSPSGLIHASIISTYSGNKVAIQNVPSFFVQTVEISIKGSEIKADISWGGNLFALIRSQDIGISVEPDNIGRLIEVGISIRDEVNKAVSFTHPILGVQFPVDLVEIYDEDKDPARNIVIFGNGQVDRSPCGTGTSAKIATLISKNEMELNDIYRYQSILGSEFQAKVLSECFVGPYMAIIPEIQGDVFLSSFQFLVLEQEDPFSRGLSLSAFN